MIEGTIREALSADGEEIRGAIENIMASGKFNRLTLEEFVGKTDPNGNVLFSEEEIRADMKKVESRSKEIEANININHFHAGFVEAAVTTAVAEAGWLGEGVGVTSPTLYDDIFRGVDVILNFKNSVSEKGFRSIGLAVDLTSSREDARSKMEKLIFNLATYGVPSVKYFKSSINQGGEKKDVYLRDFKLPKVIISCGAGAMAEANEAILHWLGNENDPSAVEAVRNCDLRYIVIQEIYLQLRFIADVFNKAGLADVSDFYNRSLQAFLSILHTAGIGLGEVEERVGGEEGFLNKIMSEADLDIFSRYVRSIQLNSTKK